MVTGTNVGKILLSSAKFQGLDGVSASDLDRQQEEWPSLFITYSLRSARRNEYLIHGAMNEDKVFSAIQSIDFVYKIFDCGMFERKQHPLLLFCPDAIALINLTKFNVSFDIHGYASVKLGRRADASSSVEIKSMIAANTIGNVLLNINYDFISSKFCGGKFKRFVPYNTPDS